MRFFGASVARSLLFSGVALAAAVYAFQQHRGGQAQRQAEWVESEKERYFPVLCFDILTVESVRFDHRKKPIELSLKDRWRLADGQPIEDAKLQVLLAQLRGLKAQKMDSKPDLEGLGLSDPTQTLEVRSGIHDQTCRVSLGQKHPTKPLYVLQRVQGDERLVGWAKLKPSGEQIIDLDELKATTVLPLRAGQIDGLSIHPQVGISPYQLNRAPGAFIVLDAGEEQRADQKLTEALLNQLVGLKGVLAEPDTPLSDPDLVVKVGHAPLNTRLEFYRQDDGLWIRTQGSVSYTHLTLPTIYSV